MGILAHIRKETTMKLRIAGTSKELLGNENFAALRNDYVITLEEAGKWEPINVFYNGMITQILGNVPFGSLGEYIKGHDPNMALCIDLSKKSTLIQLPDDMLLETVNNDYNLGRKIYICDYPKNMMVDMFVYPAEKITQNAIGSMYHVPLGLKCTEVIRIFRKSKKMNNYNMYLWDEENNVMGQLINYSNRIGPKDYDFGLYEKHFVISAPLSVIVKEL